MRLAHGWDGGLGTAWLVPALESSGGHSIEAPPARQATRPTSRQDDR
jgi:hypothetical protein